MKKEKVEMEIPEEIRIITEFKKTMETVDKKRGIISLEYTAENPGDPNCGLKFNLNISLEAAEEMDREDFVKILSQAATRDLVPSAVKWLDQDSGDSDR